MLSDIIISTTLCYIFNRHRSLNKRQVFSHDEWLTMYYITRLQDQHFDQQADQIRNQSRSYDMVCYSFLLLHICFNWRTPSFCAIALIALVSFLVPPDRLLLIMAIAINSIIFVMAQITCKSSHSPNVHAVCWFRVFSQHYCSSRNYPLYVFHPYTKFFSTKSYLKVYLISAVSMWAHSTTTLEKCFWQAWLFEFQADSKTRFTRVCPALISYHANRTGRNTTVYRVTAADTPTIKQNMLYLTSHLWCIMLYSHCKVGDIASYRRLDARHCLISTSSSLDLLIS